MVRQPADWMYPADDRILELIRDHGNLTPGAISELGGPSRSHASRRCAELAEYGLLTKISRGLYGITDEGVQYLDEDLDASELKPISDS